MCQVSTIQSFYNQLKAFQARAYLWWIFLLKCVCVLVRACSCLCVRMCVCVSVLSPISLTQFTFIDFRKQVWASSQTYTNIRTSIEYVMNANVVNLSWAKLITRCYICSCYINAFITFTSISIDSSISLSMCYAFITYFSVRFTLIASIQI